MSANGKKLDQKIYTPGYSRVWFVGCDLYQREACPHWSLRTRL